MPKLWNIFKNTRQLETKFFWLVFLGFSIALVRDTVYQGNDFRVFWFAGLHLIQGEPVYSLARDGAMAFKYPPWVAGFFLPWGVLPEIVARWAFGIFNVGLLAAVILRLRKSGLIRDRVLYLCTACFWGIWAVHALDGQIGLLILFIALVCAPLSTTIPSAPKDVFLLWALSIKAFPVFSLLGWRWERNRLRGFIRRMFWAGFIFLLISSLFFVTGSAKGFSELFESWLQAASSGSEQFGIAKVLGRDNQGFPALLMRFVFASRTTVPPWAESVAFFISAGIVLPIYVLLTEELNETVRWWALLGVIAALHPLAWFHVFVWSFPLIVAAVEKAWKDRDLTNRALSVLSLACVALITHKTCGKLGGFLEFFSIKAWGVILALVVLHRGKRLSSR